jgi:hypothetical protein
MGASTQELLSTLKSMAKNDSTISSVLLITPRKSFEEFQKESKEWFSSSSVQHPSFLHVDTDHLPSSYSEAFMTIQEIYLHPPQRLY